MKILFVGESWRGSCARSTWEALARTGRVQVEAVFEDTRLLQSQMLWARAINRLAKSLLQRKLDRKILTRALKTQPDVFVTYKGWNVRSSLLAKLRRLGILTANIYPDYSPHAYGVEHQTAVGCYDVVISSKPFHPALWRDTYGYSNRCVFCAQGYDSTLHFVMEPPSRFKFDMVLVATYRKEYGRLMHELARELDDDSIRVAIGGNGWKRARATLPAHWVFPGETSGCDYIDLLRSGKICLAPLTREVRIYGQPQPGDVYTTRTFELAAANCFFIHRRTDYAMMLYGPDEVPMFDDAVELARHVKYFLAHETERAAMAERAHRRAVPAYSLDARVAEIIEILQDEVRCTPK